MWKLVQELLTAQEVSPIIRMPKARVYQLIAEGILPHVRIGKSIRVPRAAFEDWLANQNTSALASVNREVSNATTE